MKNIVAIFTDLNEFSVKRELLFRYLNSIDDQVYYVVLTNKRLGKINRFYSNNRMIISLGYKENIDRQFVKSHLDEIAYFIASYNIEKVYYCDKELDILSKHFLIQKIDESYYQDILEVNHHIALTYNERSLLIDFSYRDNIKPFEKEVINNLIASGLYKINLFIRKNDRKGRGARALREACPNSGANGRRRPRRLFRSAWRTACRLRSREPFLDRRRLHEGGLPGPRRERPQRHGRALPLRPRRAHGRRPPRDSGTCLAGLILPAVTPKRRNPGRFSDRGCLFRGLCFPS